MWPALKKRLQVIKTPKQSNNNYIHSHKRQKEQVLSCHLQHKADGSLKEEWQENEGPFCHQQGSHRWHSQAQLEMYVKEMDAPDQRWQQVHQDEKELGTVHTVHAHLSRQCNEMGIHQKSSILR